MSGYEKFLENEMSYIDSALGKKPVSMTEIMEDMTLRSKRCRLYRSIQELQRLRRMSPLSIVEMDYDPVDGKATFKFIED